MIISRNNKRLHRKRRIRAKVSGTATCPRLAIFRSLSDVYAQLIDDERGMTLAAASAKSLKAGATVEGAKKVGKAMADKCKELKIGQIVFDRSGYRYHGKVKALADAMREEGLKF
ncbi:MAG: 50S ribosomal protein L18 [Candidatus Moraniibacteriota bacterium]